MCIRYIVYKIVTVFKSIKINIGHEKFLFDNLLIWDFSTEFPLDFKALFYLGSKTQRLNYILRKFFICERIFRGLVWFLWVSRVAIGTPSPNKIVRDTYDWHVKRSFVFTMYVHSHWNMYFPVLRSATSARTGKTDSTRTVNCSQGLRVCRKTVVVLASPTAIAPSYVKRASLKNLKIIVLFSQDGQQTTTHRCTCTTTVYSWLGLQINRTQNLHAPPWLANPYFIYKNPKHFKF